MATLLTHPIIPIAIGISCGRNLIPLPLILVGVVLSVLPDLDVIMLSLGVPWGSVYAHRGFTHSIMFALALSVLMSFTMPYNRPKTFFFCFIVVLSHSVLDALTWGGQGVALYWPFDVQRVKFESRPIPASPMSVVGFMRWGEFVLRSELQLVWAPLTICTSVIWAIRKQLIPRLY